MSQLIIFIEFKSLFREEAFKTFHVFVPGGWATVQQQDFNAGMIAEPLGPDLELTHRGLNGDHPDASGLNSTFAIIKITGNRHAAIAGLGFFAWRLHLNISFLE
jgi:hypothetical protein